MTKININDRVSKLRNSLEDLQLDAAVILSVENRIYFSQFTGSSGALIITKDETYLLTDYRYSEQATKQAKEYEVIRHTGTLIDSLGKHLKAKNINRIGIEGSMAFSHFRDLEKNTSIGTFDILDQAIMSIRKIKDEYEVSCIHKGITLCDMAFNHIINYIQPGMSEKEIGLELEYFMKKNGADQIKSNHIIASGERSSLPHGVASSRIVNEGEFVKMDIGAIIEGYYSDFTRTVVIGEPTVQQREIYQVVFDALEASLRQIGPGKTAAEIDEVGRSVIRNAGYNEYSGNSLGHSLGLNIHESPFLRVNDHTPLEPGMVITVEPGIYIPGWGGVRIEDLVVIRENGHNNLTTATKELQIIPIRSQIIN
ncbi:Xaa-Pro peptidase family protein [Bacillus sp. JJ1503]|uniref:M24 family metallopeptidase n=1 Tax=Bacillus sp. JJ1503 TaxID=3122956 RepID=UPI002FFD8271